MATQTVEFVAESGLTLTVKRFAVGSDTVIDTVSATEEANRRSKYRIIYTDIPAAEYELFVFNGSLVVAVWYVTLTLTTATFQVESIGGRGAASTITEVSKIPRSATALAAGAEFTHLKTSSTGTTLIERIQ